MSSVTIEKLYTNYAVLSEAKDNVAEYSKEYEAIIEGIRGGEKEKQLASQVIAKFFKYFPALQNRAIEALLDICEDNNISIRKQAIKVLPLICKDSKQHTSKVADILSQLLQLEDSQEQNIANFSLVTVILNEPIIAFESIFKQINFGDDIVREKCLKFLVNKYRTIDPEIITKEVDDLIINECKKILKVSSAEEFQNVMNLLTQTRLVNSEKGRQEFVELAMDQAELDNKFDPFDKENDNVDRIIFCIRVALPYFSKKTNSSKFIQYLCEQILPQLDVIGSLERGNVFQIELLKQLAELTVYYQVDDYVQSNVAQIFEVIKNYMPLPPENGQLDVFPTQDYSIVEYLLFSFHRLCRYCTDFLTNDAQLLRDFRLRLQFFARGVQSCLKTLQSGVSEIDLKKREYKLKTNSLKTASNINTIIKDLFHSPPSYKSVLVPSWTVTEKTLNIIVSDSETTSNKRHTPITFGDGLPISKQMRVTTNGYKSSNNGRTYSHSRNSGSQSRRWVSNKRSWN